MDEATFGEFIYNTMYAVRNAAGTHQLKYELAAARKTILAKWDEFMPNQRADLKSGWSWWLFPHPSRTPDLASSIKKKIFFSFFLILLYKQFLLFFLLVLIQQLNDLQRGSSVPCAAPDRSLACACCRSWSCR